nr:hypothetical protein [Tanacetum cinerariifolium]
EFQFLAAEGITGFHPKAVFWQEADGSCHSLLGSSNLSRAAFTSNYEANGYAKISSQSFAQAKEWITRLKRQCVTLDATWIEKYREAVQPPKPPKPGGQIDDTTDSDVYDLELPTSTSEARQREVLRRRRDQIDKFSHAKKDLIALFTKASRARVWEPDRNEVFYWALKDLWSYDAGNRFQGAGWERQDTRNIQPKISRSWMPSSGWIATPTALSDPAIISDAFRLCRPLGRLFEREVDC